MIDCALEWIRLPDNISESKPQKEKKNGKNSLKYQWTGKPVELLELALSVHEQSSINNGNMHINETVNFFFDLFGLKPGNFSSAYGVMRSRADSRTLYLDRLKKGLDMKMDKDDEKLRNRQKR